jgi:hypothetical protein
MLEKATFDVLELLPAELLEELDALEPEPAAELLELLLLLPQAASATASTHTVMTERDQRLTVILTSFPSVSPHGAGRLKRRRRRV